MRNDESSVIKVAAESTPDAIPKPRIRSMVYRSGGSALAKSNTRNRWSTRRWNDW